MHVSRRCLLAVTSLAIASGIAGSARSAGGSIRAIAFDGFAIFDPRPIAALTEELFPGRGAQLSNVWRAKQFEYAWLRTATGRYREFPGVIADALDFACGSLDIDLTNAGRDALVESYLKMPAWPDVVPSLSRLKEKGIRLALLSNFSSAMLAANARNAELEALFEFQLSTDAVRVYKPHPRTYQMGLDAFGLKREDILFVAFAGWDASGAKLFGYPTFWLNRQRQLREQLDAVPDGEGQGMTDLIWFALS